MPVGDETSEGENTGQTIAVNSQDTGAKRKEIEAQILDLKRNKERGK